MTEAHRTLVPFDFSPSALLLAKKERSPVVRVVHVVPTPTVPLGPGEVLFAADLDTRIRGDLERMLRETVAARKTDGVKLESQLLIGAIPSMIVDDAMTTRCARIVLGSTRPGPLARVLLGSVSDRVVRTSHVDVVVVPVPAEPSHPRDRIRNVVCATDFSGPAETALLHALAIARAHDARLHLVHTWDVAPYIERIAEMRASIERELAAELEATAHRHEVPGVPILRALRRGHPPEEAIRLAIEVEADLLVVGTTGKRGVDRLLLGSVAERIARTSPVPVLVARATPDGMSA